MICFLTDAFGNPWTAAYIGAVGDPVADLSENMAAEQKARAVYENLIELATDPPSSTRWFGSEKEKLSILRCSGNCMTDTRI